MPFKLFFSGDGVVMLLFCRPWPCLLLLGFAFCPSVVRGQETNSREIDGVIVSPDVVFGHKFGLAMTMDIFTPAMPKGVGVLFMVSGGWYSNWAPPEELKPLLKPLTDAGFTVFAVRHGSSPRFTIPEAVVDVQRAVRFVRSRAADFGISPERIGVFGMSAGGHLSLVLGTMGDDGNPDASDPIERTSNRVQAVVAWVAPTDLTIVIHSSPESLPAHKQFPALNLDRESAERHSPLFRVGNDDAPTLLLAGAKDELVPISHSRRIRDEFGKHGVDNRLVEFPDAGHGLAGDDLRVAVSEMLSWFQRYLISSAEIRAND